MAKKILIIDDDPNIIKTVRDVLEAKSFAVVTACDGEEGLEKAHMEKPDLIILDIVMPRMDGYTFLLKFRKIEKLKGTPIIMLTSREMLKDLFGMEKVSDFLVKPLDTDILLEKINKHLIK